MASASFLTKVATKVEEQGREIYAYVDAGGVTVRLGNAPQTGVTEADLALAATLISIS